MPEISIYLLLPMELWGKIDVHGMIERRVLKYYG